ncbi:hypothetical protein OG496_04810 [Streptomyces sp. NBC_00988]|nr:hypothetical protein OG496_04810 [Streptomyces sp. NBC_00988]
MCRGRDRRRRLRRASERSESYGGGPIEFHALLSEWRESSDMGDVIAE